jgi:hypothetical protein
MITAMGKPSYSSCPRSEVRDMACERGVTRRDVLRSVGTAMVSLPLVVMSGLWMGQEARAQQKVPKEAVKYQNTPKDGQQCAGCNNFVPPTPVSSCMGRLAHRAGVCCMPRSRASDHLTGGA